ncbi:MAG: SRPBCC domain-containing protein [Colwellia sp.]|nr:SRPBCC domain-containing protein [Colwellia sp.]MCW8864731.1 SRPBCC domain-containing protein [Colwellia sp.]MCW9081898.1 SRPBCC domain-containing protein [Colwellia sp.]
MKQFLFFLTFLSFELAAEVVSSGDNGFIIQIEKTVDADNNTAYQQFLRVGEWWQDDHTWFGNSAYLSIDAKAGGCFCETDGESQALHMTVSYVVPGIEIRMIGGLGPLQMMGVNGGMSWKFDSVGKGKTKITHRYQVSGYVKGGLGKLATIVDNVQASQVAALTNKIMEH